MRSTNELVKHSGIYAIGQILSRFASVLVLPLYTHYLTPSDYGVIAILDLTTMILAMLIGSGISQAVTRYHFDAANDEERRRVWWTGSVYVAAMSAAVVTPMWLGRELLAHLTLGDHVEDGGFLYTLALATLVASAIGEVLDTYIRVKKWSGLYLAVSMGRLVLNLGLNVWFLVGLGMGVKGQLLGNLIANVVHMGVLFVIFRRSLGRMALDLPLINKMLTFGWPLIAQALLALMMHDADRYFLRIYCDMKEVGIYSLAYKVAQAVNTLCLIPFNSIWSVTMYEIAKMPDAKRQYAKVFRYFVGAIMILMLGASLSAVPLLPVLTTDAYDEAVRLLPVLLLGQLLFALHSQFNVPAMLAKKTVTLVPAGVAGVITNVVLCFALIPVFGAAGAAWASVVTYGVFSLVGLIFYRRIDVIPYSFAHCGATMLGIGVTYVVIQHGVMPGRSLWFQLAVANAVCASWAIVLFGRPAYLWLRERYWESKLRAA